MKQELTDVVIRFSGDSGDGMQLTGTLFSDTSALVGNSISTFPDYPAEIRAPQGTVAGVSGFQVHFGSGNVINPGDYCDLLVAMNPAALKANFQWLKKGATILCDADSFNQKGVERAGFCTEDPFKELGLQDYNIVLAPISSMTKEALAESGLDAKSIIKCKNMFALGVCYYLYDRPLEHTFAYLNLKFKRKPAVAEANRTVIKAGYNYAGNAHIFANQYVVPPTNIFKKGKYRTINGNQATAWGFCAAAEKSGRPLFCGSYPITPATGILEELAKRKDLQVKTLQAEDEIAGICTAIGAAFAGNFAVTTTSGPGLSLKSEALGLAVMTELPLVVVDVQRGGPSTGLPTKTEQSDLAQALWGRNGECPMVVMAASHPSDCFNKAFYASKIALEHMTPVLLLTDGFIANGSEPWLIPEMCDYPKINPPIVYSCPEGGYKPYVRDEKRLARSWALPGTAGLEHRIGGLEKDFLSGVPSHNPLNHQKMVDIRAAKVARVADFIPEQEIHGDADGGELLVIGWGGTYGNLRTVVDTMRSEGKSVSHAHFSHINPLPKNTLEVLKKFKKIVVCELNMGQFVNYLRMNFQEFDFKQFNKVQGLPFTTIELAEKFSELLG
ncbi:2-oxoglutarate oxidoreductase, alpha subunit [Mucinivorans hirudinis]|uniref:2-oxoglutarate oxidoreductase, alpha subunit n=1 Tax=Mucinivorans hirudinis TaxID=1433126 RepID=A0A060RCW1_9BACT|nr:2-oxoglutarate oxidoreductase, alpha subunit [Mucinivorans hirudinis]